MGPQEGLLPSMLLLLLLLLITGFLASWAIVE